MLTIEDFECLPDELAHNHELIDGQLIDVGGNTPDHHGLRDTLTALLRPFVRLHGLGKILAEQDYEFDGNAHGPDVSFINPEKVQLLERDRRVQRFVPDMAIEIASPNDRFEALLKKVQRYRQCGTKEVWIFSVETREAFRYSSEPTIVLSDNDVFCSALIPGFSIRLGDLVRSDLSRWL